MNLENSKCRKFRKPGASGFLATRSKNQSFDTVVLSEGIPLFAEHSSKDCYENDCGVIKDIHSKDMQRGMLPLTKI